MLVREAAKLLDNGGPGAVTLREVGRCAGVSHNAPYKHFTNKEALLAAIAAKELEQQSREMARLISERDPLIALRTAARRYVEWALRHPARFKLTFGSWTTESPELKEAALGARSRLIAIVERAQAHGSIPPGSPDRLAYLLLATAHGAADLAIGGHLSATRKGGVEPQALLDDFIDLLQRARPQRERSSA